MKKWLLALIWGLLILAFGLVGFYLLGNEGDMAFTANQNTKSMEKIASPQIMADESRESAEGGENQQKEINASMEIEVEDTEEALDLIKYEVAVLDGEITNLRSWQTGIKNEKLAYQLTVRILPEEIENLMLSLEELGTKKGQYISQVDVTEVVADLVARIDSEKKYKATLEALLGQKSDNLESLLQINKVLQTTQTQIERLQAQQKNQSKRIEKATLQLTITPKTKPEDVIDENWSSSELLSSLRFDFIQNTRIAFAGVLKVLAAVPLWGPIALLLFIGWLIVRFRK